MKLKKSSVCALAISVLPSLVLAKDIDPSIQASLGLVVRSTKHCAEVAAPKVIETSMRNSKKILLVANVGQQPGKRVELDIKDVELNVQTLSKSEEKLARQLESRIKSTKDFRKYSFCVDLASTELVRDSFLNNDLTRISIMAQNRHFLSAHSQDPVVARAALTLARSSKMVAPPLFTVKVIEQDSGNKPATGYTVQLLIKTKSDPTTFMSEIVSFRGVSNASGEAVLAPYGIANHSTYFTGTEEADYTKVFSSSESKNFTWLPVELAEATNNKVICRSSDKSAKIKTCSNSSWNFGFGAIDPEFIEDHSGKKLDISGLIPLTIVP